MITVTPSPRYVPTFCTHPVEFSVIMLVASEGRYQRLLRSFAQAGFTDENAEFIAVDNRAGNAADGYGGLRLGASHASGAYLLYTHDDIEVIDDGVDALRDAIAALDAYDARWSLAGVAGALTDATGRRRILRNLADPIGDDRDVSAPVRVDSLDECCLPAPARRIVFDSLDLDGFHHFGVDLCIQSAVAGGGAYVMPFHIRHHSRGSVGDAYRDSHARLQRKYAGQVAGRRIHTVIKTVYIGSRGAALRRLDRVRGWVERQPRRIGRAIRRLSAQFGAGRSDTLTKDRDG